MNDQFPPDFPDEYQKGQVEFFYENFLVTPDVLIPRLETESLVRKAIKYIQEASPDILIDVGTGSGIIPISILRNTKTLRGYALDISSEALEVAKSNAKDMRNRLMFLNSDLLGVFLEEREILEKGLNILMTANLPYIKADDWENMSADTIYEPRLALFGGEQTGFELYEKLFEQMKGFIKQYDPKSLIIMIEMGEDQKEIATQVLKNYGWKFSFFADLRGFERFIKIQIR